MKQTLFRKISNGIWATGAEAAIYGHIDFDIHEAAKKDVARFEKSPLPWMVPWLSDTFSKESSLHLMRTCIGTYRKRQQNFVLLVDSEDKDLRFVKLEPKDMVNREKVQARIEVASSGVRKDRHFEMGHTYKLLKFIPNFLITFALNFFQFVIYDLNIPLTLFGIPRDPFGPIVITNIGSLGLDQAFVPIVPIVRPSVMVAVGKVQQKALVIGGVVEARYVLPLSFTVDHRYMDGAHCAEILIKLKTTLPKFIQ